MAMHKNVEIDGVKVTHDVDIPKEEVEEYVKRGKNRFGARLKGMDIEVDPIDSEYVNLTYDTSKVPFQRLRRITGYLVGDLNRWNNAKRAEEGDRVKHDTE